MPITVPVVPIRSTVLPDHQHLGSTVEVPAVAQFVCRAGVEAVIHPVGAAYKYVHSAARSTPHLNGVVVT